MSWALRSLIFGTFALNALSSWDIMNRPQYNGDEPAAGGDPHSRQRFTTKFFANITEQHVIHLHEISTGAEVGEKIRFELSSSVLVVGTVTSVVG
jgi:hypothetical protein